MLYRVIIKSASGLLYYLTSGKEGQAIDDFSNSDSIEFSSYVENASQFHTFSTLDAANAAIAQLMSPYNERASVLEFNGADSRLPVRIYYRLAIQTLKEPLKWFKNDGTSGADIVEQTVDFDEIEEVSEFKNSLTGWDKRQSKIVEVRDYGAPDYDFDYSFVGSESWFRCDDENPTIVKV